MLEVDFLPDFPHTPSRCELNVTVERLNRQEALPLLLDSSKHLLVPFRYGSPVTLVLGTR